MVISTKELLELYKDYKVPKMKIKSEIEKGKYFYINRGLYETDKNTPGYLIAPLLKSPSYLSFEYVLSYYGLIPESVYVYTSATTGQKHTFEYENIFGRFSYQDVPIEVFPYAIEYIVEGDYSYLLAKKEKALCDLLSIKKPVNSKKQLYSLLFDSLRIDYDEFLKLDFDLAIKLCDLYKRTNLKYFKSLLEDFKNGKYRHRKN